MARLIEIDARTLPKEIFLQLGDLIVFDASGGYVLSGGDVVDLMGPFIRAVVTDGRAVAPVGSPNLLVIRVTRQGSATINLVLGDPWRTPRTVQLVINVTV